MAGNEALSQSEKNTRLVVDLAIVGAVVCNMTFHYRTYVSYILVLTILITISFLFPKK
jgi:hypothetical protein